MAHPRCGLAAASPSRGLSSDVKGPVDLSRLAKSRAFAPGAACKARQRTGKPGSSAASAWVCGGLRTLDSLACQSI